MTTPDLFGDLDPGRRTRLGPRAWVLRGFALPHVDALLAALADIEAAAPLRHMKTPGGFTMSAAWHPRSQLDPANMWLRETLADIARNWAA